MANQDWKAILRADLDRIGERAVRDDMNTGGGLATGGEDRKQIIRAWLREQDEKREAREAAAYDLTQRTFNYTERSFNYTQRTYYVAIAALIATLVGIAIALLHL
ncbi:hypothetical protein JQ621_03085 [Bradyrhizobium manausense]|uniref:hypothetical protein n=1 Tax=Bradyrhizobium manausense TaxID=989370 RepID=UPI001BA682C7|nr:hypothetical protein [Bradyrhizobium manausense]MBR1086452.1 hypothetical protein [Bradyrhizobium manausense]